MSFTPHINKQAKRLAFLATLDLNAYTAKAEVNKEAYLSTGRIVLRAIAKHYGVGEYKISTNRAGIAVSGDVYLMAMFDNDRGIYIHMSEPRLFGGTPEFYYRTITHMKDYTGGRNQTMTYDTLAQDLESACALMKRNTI